MPYYADLAPPLLRPQSIPTAASRSGVSFEPLGLVFAVMPWNYPVWQAMRFAVPALAAGNACLVKPAPTVPQSSHLLLELARDAGLDVFDLAWIDNPDAEAAIAASNGLAFTGSTATGRHLAALAGRHLKKSVLELGGSNPVIVLKDADVELAAREAATSRFRDAGQSCNAAKRMILVPEIADAFIEAFMHEVARRRTGDPAGRAAPAVAGKSWRARQWRRQPKITAPAPWACCGWRFCRRQYWNCLLRWRLRWWRCIWGWG